MKLSTLLLTLALLFSGITWADDKAAQALNEQLRNFQSMQADFRQTIKTADGKLLQQSIGSMALQRPGQFRWVITLPNKQLIIANKSKLWVYDEDLAQVTVQSVTKNYASPAFLLSDSNEDLMKKFAVKQLEAISPEVKIFLLQPKQQGELYASLQLFFKAGRLTNIMMIDGLEQVTTIQFNKIRLNEPLAHSLFEFVTPPGVEMIEQ